MEAADDVKLGDRFGIPGGRDLKRLVERHGVAGRVALLAPEGAQLAGGYAHVGRIDVAIDVEVGHVAVQALAHKIRQPAHGQYVIGPVERKTLFAAETLARHHTRGNRLQPLVVGAKRSGSERDARARFAAALSRRLHSPGLHTIDDTGIRAVTHFRPVSTPTAPGLAALGPTSTPSSSDAATNRSPAPRISATW